MKKYMCLFMALIMCFTFVIPVSASVDTGERPETLSPELISLIEQKKAVDTCVATTTSTATTENTATVSPIDIEKIESLYAELSDLYLRIELATEEVTIENEKHLSFLYKRLDEVNQQLKQLGSVELTLDEINNSISTNDTITPPANTANVTFQAYGPVNYSYKGGTYKYYKFTAVPKTGNCVLGKNVTIRMEENINAGDYAKGMFSIYVQKAAGAVPVLRWTPYELLFGGTMPSQYSTMSSNYNIVAHYRTTGAYYFVLDKYGHYTQGLHHDICRVTDMHNLYIEQLNVGKQNTTYQTHEGHMCGFTGTPVELAITNVYKLGGYGNASTVDRVAYYRPKSKTDNTRVLVLNVPAPMSPGSMYTIQ